MLRSLKNLIINIRLSRKTNSLVEDSVIRNTTLQGYNIIRKNSCITNSVIGKMTYIGSYSIITSTTIGNFTSIAADVKIIQGNHPTRDFVSSHPIFYDKYPIYTFKTGILFDEYKYTDSNKIHFVSIGNDVWIGSGVKILNGVKIGDGSIVAAGSVVVKDIEPYSIVGGIPAKLIRKRFSEDEIQKLLKLKWWDKDLEWISRNADLFDDINKLINCKD